MREQTLFCQFRELNRLFTRYGREVNQEFIKGDIPFQVVEQRLNGNTSAAKTWRTADAPGVYPDDIVQRF